MDYKEVEFMQYCTICKHRDKLETESPCDECLCEAYNLHSHKPVCWVGDEREMKLLDKKLMGVK